MQPVLPFFGLKISLWSKKHEMLSIFAFYARYGLFNGLYLFNHNGSYRRHCNRRCRRNRNQYAVNVYNTNGKYSSNRIIN